MLNFLLLLKSMYFTLASTYKKSLFPLGLFSCLLLDSINPDTLNSFLLYSFFLAFTSFLSHSHSFLKLDAVLQCWAELEGSFTYDIFVKHIFFLLKWVSFFQITSLICHRFSDFCPIIQCVYRLLAWAWFYPHKYQTHTYPFFLIIHENIELYQT